MAIAEYKPKGSIYAFHFTDPINDLDLLCDFGLKVICVTIKYNDGFKHVRLNAYVNSKCIFEALLGDYIIHECMGNMSYYKVVPQEMFEQMYEYVKNVEIHPDDDTCDTVDTCNPAYKVKRK